MLAHVWRRITRLLSFQPGAVTKESQVIVAIDPDKEVLQPVARPRSFGSQRSRSTIERWIKRGIRSRVTGEVVQLEGFYEGTVLYTTRAAYLRFLRKLNGVD